jgi:hypothetical protein
MNAQKMNYDIYLPECSKNGRLYVKKEYSHSFLKNQGFSEWAILCKRAMCSEKQPDVISGFGMKVLRIMIVLGAQNCFLFTEIPTKDINTFLLHGQEETIS